MLALASCSEGELFDKEELAVDLDINPLLYEISNADGEVEGWMLGTIHALPGGVEWRTPAIDTVMAEADTLIVEVGELNDDAAIAETFRALATTPDMGSLSLRVSRDWRGALDEMVQLSEIPPDQFYNTETWAAAIMLARVGAVGSPRNGVDRYAITQFEGRPTVGLETAQEQLGIFDTLPQADQRDLLEGTIEEWMASRDNPNPLWHAWIEGDVPALEEATSEGIMADPELRNALLVGRNESWMPAILNGLEQDDRPLIAVGAGHLVGEDGLPAMLESAGYSIRRAN